MADIWSVFDGQPGFDALCAMTLGQLSAWHQRAADRAERRNRG